MLTFLWIFSKLFYCVMKGHHLQWMQSRTVWGLRLCRDFTCCYICGASKSQGNKLRLYTSSFWTVYLALQLHLRCMPKNISNLKSDHRTASQGTCLLSCLLFWNCSLQKSQIHASTPPSLVKWTNQNTFFLDIAVCWILIKSAQL